MSDEQDREAKSSPEVVEASIEKMRKLLHAPPREERAAAANEKVRWPKVEMMSDVGHGTKCTCEVCWQMRMLEVFPGAVAVEGKIEAKVEEPKSVEPKKESKLEMLKRLFPL